MFVNVDLEKSGLSFFRWLPHAVGLVQFGGDAATVPPNLIHAIRQTVEKIAAAGGVVFDGLKPGDRVRIQGGPFAGYEAIFDARIPGKDRVRVLLKLLENPRDIPVELAAGQIQKVK